VGVFGPGFLMFFKQSEHMSFAIDKGLRNVS